MPETQQKWVALAIQTGLTHAAVLTDPKQIEFHAELRDLCKANSCGKYASSWMGPPALGEIAELSQKIKSYHDGLVFQYVAQLADAYDVEGWTTSGIEFDRLARALIRQVRREVPADRLLALTAGCCHFCGECAYPQGRPCRSPENALASVEACGIIVNELLTMVGLAYNNGPATLSYTGLLLFK